ncbi:MAG: Fe-S cluster assembly protein SufD, partial [Ignavibacteriae bacterium]
MDLINQNIKWYESTFEAFEQGLNGEKSTSVHAIRRDAIRRFKDLGFPTKYQEEWRFTNIDPITKIAFQPVLRYDVNGVTKKDIQPSIVDDAHLLVFVDGMFSSELSDVHSLPPEVTAGSLHGLLKNHPEPADLPMMNLKSGVENAFTALNTAFLWDGALIFVPKGVVLDSPIQLLFVASDRRDASAAQPRNIIAAGMGSRFKIIETYVGLANNTYLTNAVTDITLEENSEVEHEKFQIEGMNAFHIGTTTVELGRASRYTSNAVAMGGSIVRNNLTARFTAEGAECVLNGLSLGSRTQLVDNHTLIDHAKPHCTSHELYKAILDGASKGVFNGKVLVRIDAQK